MLPRALKLLEKPLALVSLDPDWPSLCRIVIWALVFLLAGKWLLNAFVPAISSQPASADSRITEVLTKSNDPFWARSEPEKFPDNGLTNVAWISGSAGKLITTPPRYTAIDTITELEKENSVRAGAFVYYMEAARIMDVLVATQDAIRREPDVIVIELDPLWMYNSTQVYRSQNVFNGAASMWWNARDWPMQFLFVAPRNHWWALIGEYLPRASLARLPNLLSSFIVKPDRPQHQGESAELLQGMMFWVSERDSPIHQRLMTVGTDNLNVWQETALLHADTDSSTWASAAVVSLLDSLRDSAIPAVVFVAPVSREILDDPDTAAAYNKVIAALAELQADYSSESIQFILQFDSETKASIEHYDRIHMVDPGLLPAVLAENIAAATKNDE